MTKEKATVKVPKEDPQPPTDKEGQPLPKDPERAALDLAKGKSEKEAKDKPAEELSEEDQQLKSELDMLVERLKENKAELHRPALETLRTLIRTSTSSMTSVPKPLKFLRPHYPSLQTDVYDRWKDGNDKRFLADILSVLAMTYSDEEKHETLKYRLVGLQEDAGLWGHEYVKHLAMEIGKEYQKHLEDTEAPPHLLELALHIVPFFLKHNAEADAVDLLLELEAIDRLPAFIDKNTYKRVCIYMLSCVSYLPPPDDKQYLQTVHKIYRDQNKFTEAIQVAIKIGEPDLIKEDFSACTDPLLQKQLAFILARQRITVDTVDEGLNDILNNTKLSEHFLGLARELDVIEAKTPEDIYKTHLENTRPGFVSGTVDSARQNLASTFVNAFVNAGFGADKLMTGGDEANGNWIYKNKEHGMMSAAASLGMILLWDVEMGLTQIDKYLYSDEEYIKAGALMAIGIVNSAVHNDSDPAIALLSEYVESKVDTVRTGAILGLGIAYAGSGREDLSELLSPLISDTNVPMEISCFAALALGNIYAGTGNGEIASTILQTMMERSDTQLKETYARFLSLGLGLIFLGKQDQADVTLETLKVIEHHLARQAEVIVEMCAYAGTGNVLYVQKMLQYCNDHLDAEKEEDSHQKFAVIGIALIAMGEDVGAEMALRSFTHLMHYGEPVIRRAVPLALGLLCASNPQLPVLDTLSKFSHDNDNEVAISAIFAMGIVGAGTNNARLAQMLRQLASYYYKEPDSLFMVRIAQGLLHMGKGTISVNPFHTDRSLMSPLAVAGLLTAFTACTDAKTFLLGRHHYLLYHLVGAMYPRFLITLNEELHTMPVNVRVGQAVDVVGQAGRPKTITGFQTHSTPVLLAHSERAELATEEYLASSHVLEGFVILKKNPDWEEEETEKTGK